jgi:phosphoribosylanthranilate isomerase
MENQMILVKNITNLSEARFCAGMMVPYISFCCDPDDTHFVDNEQYIEIKKWLSGIKLLGNAETHNYDEINDYIEKRSLDGFILSSSQFDLIEFIDTPLLIGEVGIDKILENDFSLPNGLQHLIIHGEIHHHLTLIENLAKTQSIFVGYDFDNVTFCSDKNVGFAFLGSKETRPGHSTYHALMDALEELDSE